MVGRLLTLLALHLVLTALPIVAAMLVAARRGVRSVPILLGLGLAVSGGAAMLSFWAYYGDRTLGETVSYLVLLGSLLAIGWSLYEGNLDRRLLRSLAIPLCLWGLGSAFLLLLGFVHGGTEIPTQTAATRFYGPLPSDNFIPSFFAHWFYLHGHAGHPLFPPDWLASDRPQLQTGYVLAQRLPGRGVSELDYEVLGLILQQLWIVALWALLLAAGIGRVTRALVMVAVLLSGVAIVNGFYVWPKLLPTAALLAAAALILTPLWDETRRRLWLGALLGALLGLAMMGHGASIFGVIPLALLALFRGLPSWRWLGALVLAGALVVVPWSAYQKWGEPPGNRLLKYQLAGVVETDNRGTLATIADSYREAGVGGTLHNKAENFVTMFGGGPMAEQADAAVDAVSAGDLETALREVRSIPFYNLIASLGLLVIAPVLMLIGRSRGPRHPAEWRLALLCFATLALGAVIWGLLMFGNEASRTVLHQGSFLLPVLGICGAVCGLRATFPRFAVPFVAFAAGLILAIEAPALDPLPGTSYSAAAAVLAAAALASFVALIVRARVPSDDEGVASPAAAAP
jgi:hypothetical protein